MKEETNKETLYKDLQNYYNGRVVTSDQKLNTLNPTDIIKIICSRCNDKAFEIPLNLSLISKRKQCDSCILLNKDNAVKIRHSCAKKTYEKIQTIIKSQLPKKNPHPSYLHPPSTRLLSYLYPHSG